MRAVAFLKSDWREPANVLAAFADEPFAIGLLSSGEANARWSYIARRPDRTLVLDQDDNRDPFAALAALLGPADLASPAEGPTFQGGIAGLCGYALNSHAEGLPLGGLEQWPDLACARYPALLAFDGLEREIVAVGRGQDQAEAITRARDALQWLEAADDLAPPFAGPLAAWLKAEPPGRHEAAVAEVVDRIARGELFQANIARRWRGRLAQGARPFDLFQRLAAQSPAPFAAYLRLVDRAVVSNSPERFLRVSREGGALIAETQPIKGTIHRGPDPSADAALARRLMESAKNLAENLMIVDLMRNDLSRVCRPGSVAVPSLFALESFTNVHHLASTVTGKLAPDRGALDLLRAAFPAGSITGAPKIQAMKVIAGLEAPRGPFFGAMIWAGFDGALDSSVLIRTAACVADAQGWSIEARAGGGIVADSDPGEEMAETETKFAALARALTLGL